MRADKTVIVRAEGHDVPWTTDEVMDHVTEAQATARKGHPHPGNMLSLPGGVMVPMQFDQNPLELRNGVLDTEILQALIDRLQVFQKGPMGCRETALAITNLEQAIHWLQHRQLDRQARAVRFTDEA